MIMCVLLCYPVSLHMLQLLLTGCPISSLFIWCFSSLSTLYMSYHDGWMEGQRKPVHTVGQGSVL